MRDINGVLGLRMLSKIELVGPLVDLYIKYMANLFQSKLSRSENTGLMSLITVFIPWPIFHHLCVLVLGYDGDMKTTERKIIVTISSHNTARKVFLPVYMNGIFINCLKKRIYRRIIQDGNFFSFMEGLQ